MSELLKTFDSDLDFSREAYFTKSYNCIASILYLKLDIESNKVNLEKVFKTLDFPEGEFTQVYKHWTTDDSSDADFSEDYTFEQLYISGLESLMIWIDFQYDTLYINFYYDGNNSLIEKRVLDLNHKMRKTYGISKSPTFNVLTKSKSSFDTEDVKTEPVKIDLEKHYNSDFTPVKERIDQSIQEKESGLILLYGKPGTGKTTYIKSLISEHSKSNFIFIQNEFVNNLLDPDFISFLLQQRNAILIIEDAEKVITSREQNREGSVVSTILQLTDGLFSDYLNIKVICTFNTSLSKIDTALLRKGRLIAKYEFDKLNLEKTNALLTSLDMPTSNEPLTVSDVFHQKEEAYTNIKTKKIGF